MHMEVGKAREGYVPVPGGMVWYGRTGQRETTPLLVLHGGPGAGHECLTSLASLADEREVIFFDQLGCGRSEAPDDPSLWQIKRFVAEVGAVRRALGLGRVYLLGHSWGGWLALEYMLTRPQGVAGLVLASTSASLPEYVREITGLVDALPEPMRSRLQAGASQGDLENPDYKAALLSFYQRHLCRLPLWPPALVESVHATASNPVYTTMQGQNEFVITGNLKEWDRTDRLAEIAVPTLVTVGRYDSITPACASVLQRGIPGAELHLFEQSAHMPHLEEPERYLHVLRRFFASVEAGG